MIGFAVSATASAFNSYLRYEQRKQGIASMEAAFKTTKQLALQGLSITYNSILAQQVATRTQAKRQLAETAIAERQAIGAARAEAGATGAAGRRTARAVEAPIQAQAGRAQAAIRGEEAQSMDSLRMQADAARFETYNRIMNAVPDVPTPVSPWLEALGTGLQTAAVGLEDYYAEEERKARIEEE